MKIKTLISLFCLLLKSSYAESLFLKKATKLCNSLDENIKQNTISPKQINDRLHHLKTVFPSGKEIEIKKDVSIKSYYSPLPKKLESNIKEDQYLEQASCIRMVKSFCSLAKRGEYTPTKNNEITLTLVDYTRPIQERRFSVIKINQNNPLKSYVLFHVHASHAGNSDPNRTGIPTEFSQKSGDNKTSCGATMTTGSLYEGAFGSARRLKGFSSEPTTKDILSQAKVQHTVGLNLSSLYHNSWASTNGCVGIGYEDPEVYGYCCHQKDTLASLIGSAVGENNFYYINCLDQRLENSPLLKENEEELKDCSLIKNIPSN